MYVHTTYTLPTSYIEFNEYILNRSYNNILNYV